MPVLLNTAKCMTEGLSTDIRTGLGAGILPPDELIQQRMEQAHHEVTYLQLLKHPTLRQMVQGLMGWKNDVLLKRTLLRSVKEISDN